MSAKRLLSAFFLACLVVVHASAIPIDFIDDAYISFRYAWHLSHGNGLVFNQGAPVEGYSNLIWVLIAATFLKLGIPLEVAMRLVAVACLAATSVLVQALLLRAGGSLSLASAIAAALALATPWVMPALNGLEGALFSLLLVIVTWLNVRSREQASPALSIGSGLAGLLLSATRPEGFLLYLLQIGASHVPGGGGPRAPGWRPHRAALITFLAGLAALTTWRFATFGSLIPTAVLAKMGSPYRPFSRVSLSPAGDGLWYCLGFIKATWPFWVLLILGVLTLRRRHQGAALSSVPFLAILAAALIAPGFAIAFVNNGDWMPDFRLLGPYVPLLVLAAGAVWIAAPSRIAVIAFLIGGVIAVSPSRLEPPSPAHLLTYTPSAFHRKLCQLGAETGKATQAHSEAIVAVEVLGVFGYCAPLLDLRDLNGLTDREIAAHEPSSGTFGRKTSASTLEAMRPDIVMYSDLNYLRILLERSPWFAREYQTLACDRLLGDPLYIYYFVRRDSPLSAPGEIPLCPADRVAPADAFDLAVCRLDSWPYPFPRDCRAGRGGRR